MGKTELLIVADYRDQTDLSLDELCDICHITQDMICDLVAHDIIHPRGSTPNEWLFAIRELERLKKALRLKRDLELNLPSIALLFDLLDEIEAMRHRLQLLEKHFMGEKR